jgi:hypothetical protein
MVGKVRLEPMKERSMVSKNPVVDSKNLKRGEVWGETDAAVHWAGAFAVYGGHGATASSTIVYEIEPGKRLGWHTDATEETQYIIERAGQAVSGRRVHLAGRAGQRVRAADADAPRPGKHRQGDASRRRILRRGDVHPGLRPGDVAAEEPYPRHAKPRGLISPAILRACLRPGAAGHGWPPQSW